MTIEWTAGQNTHEHMNNLGLLIFKTYQSTASSQDVLL